MRIALTGNPNSGKTTMYNALTGLNEKIGNWAGVTVDRKESTIKKAYYNGEKEVIAVDLPGAYSMSPFTSEESITRMIGKGDYKMASRKTVTECCEKAGLKLESFEIRKGMRLHAVVRK